MNRNDTVCLNFRHALAKITIDSLTNSLGRKIELKEIKMTADLYTSGTLTLTDGTWPVLPTASSQEITRSFTSLEVEDDQSRRLNDKANAVFVIPKDKVDVAFDITYKDTKLNEDITLSFKKTLYLKQGKNIKLNFRLATNHEVIIIES